MSNADDALAAAEAAEAEAAEAEAVAAAARARARAVRLRHEAEAAAATTAAAENTPAETVAAETVADVPAAHTELTESSADTVVIEDTAEAADRVPVATAAPTKRRSFRPSATIGKVAAATVVVIASIGLLGLAGAIFVNHRSVAAQQDRRAEFAAAARQGVVTLMSLDFNRAQQDVDSIIGITTGDFKKDFENQAADMVKVAQENKVVTQVTVNAVAVQQMTNDTATVLLAAMSTVSNAASQKQEPRAWRLSVDVARDGDQIKLAKVEFVP